MSKPVRASFKDNFSNIGLVISALEDTACFFSAGGSSKAGARWASLKKKYFGGALMAKTRLADRLVH